MKCPKCGFNSFDHLTNCKKCGTDLKSPSPSTLKSRLFPGRRRTTPPDIPNEGAASTGITKTEIEPQKTPPRPPSRPSSPSSPARSSPAREEKPPVSSHQVATAKPASRPTPQSESETLRRQPPAPKPPPPPPSEKITQRDIPVGIVPSTPFPDVDTLPEIAEIAPSNPPAIFPKKTTEPPPKKIEQTDEDLENFDLATVFLSSLDGAEENPGVSIPSPPPLVADSWSLADLPDIEASSPPPRTLAPESVPPPAEPAPNTTRPSLPPLPKIGTRLSASTVDLLILGSVFWVFLFVGELAVSPDGSFRFFPSEGTILRLAIPYFLIIFVLSFGYFTLFHALSGQTPGKMLLRLKVENGTGGQLLPLQAFLRSAGGLLCLIPLGAGYLSVLFNSERRGWNDRMAGSRVVTCGKRTDEISDHRVR